MTRPDLPPSAAAGFTLLEVLIAFIIAAFALGALFRGAVESQAASATAAEYMQALSRARSRLAALDAQGPPRILDQQGDDGGGFHYQTRATALQASPEGAGPGATLYAVSIAVSWGPDGHRRAIQLETRRLGPAQPKPP